MKKKVDLSIELSHAIEILQSYLGTAVLERVDQLRVVVRKGDISNRNIISSLLIRHLSPSKFLFESTFNLLTDGALE